MPTTIGDVVSQFIIETDDDSQHDRARLLNIAISGAKELAIDLTGENIFEELTLDSNSTAAIPSGLINVIAMYINIEGYGLSEIAISDKLPPNIVQSDGEVTKANRDASEINIYNEGFNSSGTGSFFQGGQFTGGIYKGVGSNPFRYRKNNSTNRFEFSSNVKKPIIEYIGELGTVKGKHLIPSVATDALMAWIRYAANRNRYTVGAGEKQFNHKQYLAAKNLLARRLAEVTAGNMKASFRSAYSLTNK
jgi:hypothetical protein|tara:strand:- start:1526 stop:2272 length:747 start_codon:yes stop_codon:yes gene_type:complete